MVCFMRERYDTRKRNEKRGKDRWAFGACFTWINFTLQYASRFVVPLVLSSFVAWACAREDLEHDSAAVHYKVIKVITT
jgi:hypothetical protein